MTAIAPRPASVTSDIAALHASRHPDAAALDPAAIADRIAAALLNTADVSRLDRLWPAHFQVFLTNPLSVAYGACGPATFLKRRTGAAPAWAIDWIRAQRLSHDRYAPGLFVGAAGIAVSLAELDQLDAGHDVMRFVYESPLRFADPTMIQGAAGWGWASLYFYDRTRDDAFLTRAIEAGCWLIGEAVSENDQLCWPTRAGEPIQLGYAHGASGIALFLFELWRRTGDTQFLRAARGALDFDLANGTDAAVGRAWGRFIGDHLIEPYWEHGTSGVATTAIRFAAALGDERYHSVARNAATALVTKFALHPGQFAGMSGIGDFLVDAIEYFGDESIRRAAEDLADTITWYGVERHGGLMFPGSYLGRFSNDYATGSAGIGFFFDRLDRGGPRSFIDLPGFV